MADFLRAWLRTGDSPDWMSDYTKRDLSLIMFAVQHAEEFYAIAPHHPLAIHCMEMKMLVEVANAIEMRDKQKREE